MAKAATKPIKITRRKRRSFLSRFTPRVNRNIGRVLKVTAVVVGGVVLVKKRETIGDAFARFISNIGSSFRSGLLGDSPGLGKGFSDALVREGERRGGKIRTRTRPQLSLAEITSRQKELGLIPRSRSATVARRQSLEIIGRTLSENRQFGKRRSGGTGRIISRAAARLIDNKNQRDGAAILAGMVGRN